MTDGSYCGLLACMDEVVRLETPKVTGEIIDVADLNLPALTIQEDNFCLAVIEYGGNLAQAYKAAFPFHSATDKQGPIALARRLLARPNIALRIRDLTESIAENTLISMGSHLLQLAEIRDLAKATAQVGVALKAEEARGRVAGLYIGKEAGTSAKAPTGGTVVMVSITTGQDNGI